ncbi:MAG: hypothetical protein ACK5MD_02200 [Flavobacteriales bacterium]
MSILALIYYRGETYFKNKINDFLAEKTNGVYHLEYDKIEIEWFDGDLKIYNFNLQFDTIKANRILTKDSSVLFFNIKIKEFEALNLKLKKIFNEEIVQMDELRLNSPKISTYGFFKRSDKKDSDFSGNNTLKNLFREIDINKISLENTSYNIYSKLVKNVKFSEAKRIDILVDRFYLRSNLTSHKKQFDIKDLSMRFLGFESMLGDSIHSLKADTLNFSLKKSYLNVSNLHVFPKYIQKDRNYFSFKVPKLYLQLKHFDLQAFDSIIVENLTLEKPEVEFYENGKKNQEKNYDKIQLYNLIKNDFKKIAVNHLQINQAEFYYFSVSVNPKLIQKTEKLDLQLIRFSIDSISETNPDKIFYADNFKMDVHHFKLNLEDRVHQFKINHFQLSSFKQDILLKGISIAPTYLKKQMAEEFFLDTDEILIKNIDFKKLYHQKSLEMEQLFLSNVTIKDNLYKKPHVKLKEISKLEDVLSPIFNQVKAKEVHLENAIIDFQDFRISYKSGRVKGKINFKLEDLDIDILHFKKNRRVLFSKNFDLILEDYEFKAPKDVNIYQAQRIELENRTNKIQINKLKINPEIENQEALKRYKIATLLNISADQIKIDKIDFQKAIFDQELNAESLEIIQPDIAVETHTKFKNEKNRKKLNIKEIEGVFYTVLNYMPQIKINRIEVPSGKVHLKTMNAENKVRINIHNTFAIHIDHFLFNEKELEKTEKNAKIFFSDNAVFTVKNQLFEMGDGVHKIKADQIRFQSKDNSLRIQNAFVFSDRKSPKYKTINNVYQVVIPELYIENMDLVRTFETDTVSIDKLALSNAKITLLNRSKKDGEAKKFTLKNIYIPLPKDVKVLKINELAVKNTVVKTYKEEKLKVDFEITSNWKNFTLINYGTDRETDFEIGDAYYHMKKIHIPLKNEQNLKIDDLELDAARGIFNVTNLSFKRKNQVKIDIPQIIFNKLNIEKLYDNNLIAESVFINNPKVEINRYNHEKKTQENTLKTTSLNLYPEIENIFNYVKFKNLKISNMDLHTEKIKQNQIDLKFEDVLIDENHYPDRLLHSINSILNVRNIKKSSKWYDFNADQLTFSTNSSQLFIKNIKVKPLFSKEEYRKVMKNQVDRVEAQIDYVKVNRVDISQWFEKEQLVADYVEIGSSKVDLYKDKRVPKIAKTKLLPQALLNKINKSFYANKLTLKPSSLHYSEYSGTTPKGGNVYLDNLSFTMNNITNINEKLNQNRKAQGRAKALFMGMGRLDVDLEFDLLAEDESHKIEGSLTDFPLDCLNEITEDAAGIRIRDGYVHQLDFKMNLTKKNALGKVNLVYDSLNIALLNKDRLKEQKFLSRLVNLILNNQSTNKQEEKDNSIYLERDDQKSFVGYWWRSILSGLKYSVGLKSKQQRKNRKTSVDK